MIVADTHTWLWWVARPRERSNAASDALERNSVVGISPIRSWELAMLAHKGRVTLERDIRSWLHHATTIAKVELLPITLAIAATAGTFPDDTVADPSDRLIVATALEHRVPLVTKDGRIRRSGLVETVW